jgi:hypothetical protein
MVFPCLRMASVRDGAAELPQWRLSPPLGDDSGAIVTAPNFGGSFATPRTLVKEEQIPVYLVGDMSRDAVSLYRWIPTTPLAAPDVNRQTETVSGLNRPGRVTVPGLDKVPG